MPCVPSQMQLLTLMAQLSEPSCLCFYAVSVFVIEAKGICDLHLTGRSRGDAVHDRVSRASTMFHLWLNLILIFGIVLPTQRLVKI